MYTLGWVSAVALWEIHAHSHEADDENPPHAYATMYWKHVKKNEERDPKNQEHIAKKMKNTWPKISENTS